MGIAYHQMRLLLEAKAKHVDFTNTLTLGRQNAYLTNTQLKQLAEDFCGTNVSNINLNWGDFYIDEAFYRLLGVQNLVSLDNSKYQDSSIAHDLNLPIGEEYYNQFDCLIDGGTLEHVFNFPIAIQNCMNMLKINGNFFMFSVANNHCGHGFYQFSPELLFRIFQPEFGFKIRQMLFWTHNFPGGELDINNQFYSLRDPKEVGARIGLVNKKPTGIFCHAIKTAHIPLWNTYPQQSDYVKRWEDGKSNTINKPNKYKKIQKNTLLSSIAYP